MKKVALVTGAGVRLGKAIAEQLHQDGYELALHYRGSVPNAPGFPFQSDLAGPGAAQDLADKVLERFGRLDLLVNSASIFYPTPELSEAEAQWDAFMQLNVKVPLQLVRSFEGTLRQQRGAVINIVDIYALRPLARFLPYCVSKGALWSLTQNLALQLAPDVRVNAVSPGAALPPPGANPQEEERLIAPIPLGRLGGAGSIAEAVSYLARADFVTGQMLCVDGGRTLRM